MVNFYKRQLCKIFRYFFCNFLSDKLLSDTERIKENHPSLEANLSDVSSFKHDVSAHVRRLET